MSKPWFLQIAMEQAPSKLATQIAEILSTKTEQSTASITSVHESFEALSVVPESMVAPSSTPASH